MEYFGRYRVNGGAVAAPRDYLVIAGTRKHDLR